MNLDDELRAALRREDPSPGFAQGVVARAKTKPAPQSWFPSQSWFPRMMWATALAAILVIGFAGVSEYRERQAERAARETVMALRIAAEKLNMARDKVLRVEN
jgi:hypothetical protein